MLSRRVYYQQTVAEWPHPIRGCTGFDGGAEAGEASRSLPVCVKRGNLKLNAKNNNSYAIAA